MMRRIRSGSGTALAGTCLLMCMPAMGQTRTWPFVLPPLTSTFSHIHFENESIGLAVSDHDFYRTIDGGATWSPWSPRPWPVPFLLREDGVYLTHERISSDGGKTWQNSRIRGYVKFDWVDASNAWGITRETIHRTRDGGASWQNQLYNAKRTLTSIFALDSNRAWIGGTAGTILRTTNGGAGEWEIIRPSPTPEDVKILRFFDPSNGWLLTANGNLWTSQDGGLTWQALASTPGLDTVHFIDPRHAVGLTADGEMKRSEDGGANWKAIATGLTAGYMQVLDDSVWWVFAKDGRYVKTRDRGLTWSRAPVENVMADLNKLVFVDSIMGWVAGAEGVLLNTRDGGDSWTTCSSGTSQDLYAIHFIDRQEGWVAGDSGIVLHTRDSGRTWQSTRLEKSHMLRAIHFLNRDTGFLAGRQGAFYRTTDRGATWSFGQLPPSDLTSVQFLGKDTGWVAGSASEQRPSTLMRTTVGGSIWNRAVYDNDVWPSQIQFLEDGIGYARNSSTVWKTTDGGSNWNAAYNFPVERNRWSGADMHFLDARTGVAISHLNVGASTPTFHWTLDGSQTRWGSETMGIWGFDHEKVFKGHSVRLQSPSIAWIAGTLGRIMRVPIPKDPIVGVPETPSHRGHSRAVRIGKTLRFSMVSDGRVTLSLFGLDGKIVGRPVTGWYRSGEHTLDLPINQLAVGPHWVRLETPKDTQVLKVFIP